MHYAVKHGRRRCGAALVAAALVMAGAAGCSRSGASSAQRPHVTFMLIDAAGSPNTGERSEEVREAIRKHTNTDIEFQWVQHDRYDEKMGLVLASPANMPMIMHVNAISGGIVDAAEAGAFWDLNEFIWDSKKYPNLSQANKEILKALTINKQLIGIYKARELGRYGIGYRTDWAEKLGLAEPKTIEDIYNMLHAFTYDDPDGNGKNDTYGLAMCRYTGPLDIIQTWFGCGNGWVELDDELVPVHKTPEYKEALRWAKKIYDEGLIAPDWAVRETTGWRDQVNKGEAGMFIDVLDGSRRIWDYLVNNNVPSVVDPTKNASMTLIGTINNRTLATPGYNGFLVITKAAKTREEVEACLHFIDKMCDDEMITLCSYGLRGYTYDIDDDGYIIDIKTDPAQQKIHASLNQSICFIPKMLGQVQPAMRQTDRKLRETAVIASNERYAVLNPALTYLSNSPSYALNGALLDQLLSDARTQYICGRIDDAGLQAAFDKWDKIGADIVHEVNEQYQRQQGRAN